ncbi:transcription intermediary factor 1-beta-like [Mya arenaria]|uniref:transcription intermediary factor 1-beta-like n=1 Tax=Mya arenaria TaxID=6604 RepID=UPI0022E92A55|nr:transcription intermediary factor 1-beta-like [Mya arenaria]
MAHCASSLNIFGNENNIQESDFENLTMEVKHDVVCEPCSLLMKTNVATLYCFDCDEKFCEQCGSVHKQSKLSRGHRMCQQEEAPPSEAIEEIKSLSTCTNHNEEYEYICLDHDALCCGKCANTGHRRCQRLETISDRIANENMRGNLLHTEVGKFLDLTKSTNEILDIIKRHKTSLDQSEALILQTIREAKSKLLSALEDLEQNLTIQISQQKADIVSEIHTKELEVAFTKQKINQNRKKSQMVVDYGTDVHKFQKFRDLQKSVIPQVSASIQRLKTSYQNTMLHCVVHVSSDELASNIKKCLSVSTHSQTAKKQAYHDGSVRNKSARNWNNNGFGYYNS